MKKKVPTKITAISTKKPARSNQRFHQGKPVADQRFLVSIEIIPELHYLLDGIIRGNRLV